MRYVSLRMREILIYCVIKNAQAEINVGSRGNEGVEDHVGLWR